MAQSWTSANFIFQGGEAAPAPGLSLKAVGGATDVVCVGHHIIVTLSEGVLLMRVGDRCSNSGKSTLHAFPSSHTSLCNPLLSVLLSRHRVATLLLVSSSVSFMQRFSLLKGVGFQKKPTEAESPSGGNEQEK